MLKEQSTEQSDFLNEMQLRERELRSLIKSEMQEIENSFLNVCVFFWK